MNPQPARYNDRQRRSARARVILIVDDTADTRELYAMYFRSRGLSVITAHDGLTGVDAAVQHRPDAIVMDLSMPGLDGIAATHKLKRDARTRHVPIVILTGYPMRGIAHGALEAGADAFLTKPCLPEDLEHHIQQLVERADRA